MDLKFWQKALKEAERELAAASTRSAVNAAANRVMLSKTELKRLDRKAPTRRRSGVVLSATSS